MSRRHYMKALTLLLTAGLILGACGGGDDNGDDKAADKTSDTTAKQLTSTNGFDGTTIKLGVLNPLSGPAALIGKPLTAGQEIYWQSLNDDKGGIAGKYKVELVIEDTLYETNTTVQKYNKIKNDVVMFSQVMGTAPNLALLPLLKEDKIVAAPASQDAFWVREQYLLPVIEPYQVDVVNAVDYWLANGGSKTAKVCAFLQNDVYGEAGLEGLTYASKEFGFTITTVTKYKSGDTDFTAQINELKSKGCEMVWASALPTEFAGATGTAAKMGFEPRWIAQSPAWIDIFAKGALRGYLEKNVWVAATGPELVAETHPAMKEILDKLAKYKPEQKPDYYLTFGYLQAIAEHQILERAVKLGDLSRDGIVEAMNTTDKLLLGGLVGDYGFGEPAKRDPSRYTTIFKVNADKPFALEQMKFNFTTDAAKKYAFKAQS